MSHDTNIPSWILACPVIYDWHRFKGVEHFCMINYDRSIKAGRPMIDLAYCATRGMNGIVLKTVQYSKKNFKPSKIK